MAAARRRSSSIGRRPSIGIQQQFQQAPIKMQAMQATSPEGRQGPSLGEMAEAFPQTPTRIPTPWTSPGPGNPATLSVDGLSVPPAASIRPNADPVLSRASSIRLPNAWNHPQPRYQPSFPDFSFGGDGVDPVAMSEHTGNHFPNMMEKRSYDVARHHPSRSMQSIRLVPKHNHPYHFGALSDIASARPPSPALSAAPVRVPASRDPPPPTEILRLPLTWWMNSNAKNHFVAMIGEFIGTTMFLFFAFAGTQVANIGAGPTTATSNQFSPIVLLYISVSFGFSLIVNVWVFFRISGGLFNPAVTLGMYMVKAVSLTRAILLVMAQLCGSLLASILVKALFPTPLNVRTTLSNGTSIAQGVFIETVLTAELVFSIFMLAKEKHKATFMAPIGIGLALFVAEMVGVYYTGGSLNPARSFGPCAVTGDWDGQQWIYWVGPALGAVLAVAFYRIIKILEYEVANPGQDAKHEEEAEEEAAAAASTLPRYWQDVAQSKSDARLVGDDRATETHPYGDSKVWTTHDLYPVDSVMANNGPLSGNGYGPAAIPARWASQGALTSRVGASPSRIGLARTSSEPTVPQTTPAKTEVPLPQQTTEAGAPQTWSQTWKTMKEKMAQQAKEESLLRRSESTSRQPVGGRRKGGGGGRKLRSADSMRGLAGRQSQSAGSRKMKSAESMRSLGRERKNSHELRSVGSMTGMVSPKEI